MTIKPPFLMIAVSMAVIGCTQTSPSMMNTAKVEIVHETAMDQIPLSAVNEGYLNHLAAQYERYGEGPVDISVTYDPSSRSFTAGKAVREAERIAASLKKKGVRNIVAGTLPVNAEAPVLMATFDTIHAQAPSDCDPMPGLENNLTGREIGDYRFGCGVESMMAQQIYRPSDLKGNVMTDPVDGRRTANVIEYYRNVDEAQVREDLERLERADLQAE